MGGIFQQSDMEKPIVVDIKWYNQMLLFCFYINYLFYLQVKRFAVVDGLHRVTQLVQFDTSE